MPDDRRSANDEKPQEEFVNDGLRKTEGGEDPGGANKMKLEEWPLQELQQKARDEGIEGYEKMNREELIEKLQYQR